MKAGRICLLSFKSAESHVVFSGDTAYLEPLADFAKGANLLIHEAMLEDALPALFALKHWMRSHTFAHDAGRIATSAGVKALALNHLIPSDDPEFGDEEWQDALSETWQGNLFIGNDGMKIPLHQEQQGA